MHFEKRNQPFFLASGCILFVGIIYVLINLFVWLTSAYEHRKTLKAMQETSFSCPEGSSKRVESWGELGWSRGCYRGNLRNGPWEAWERRRISILGYFLDGEQAGKWEYYDDDGDLSRIEEYGPTDRSRSQGE